MQVSSMLSATYTVPWPPVYMKLVDAMGAVNIDVEIIRKPMNDLFALLGPFMKDFSCNFNNMDATTLFYFHYGQRPWLWVAFLRCRCWFFAPLLWHSQ